MRVLIVEDDPHLRKLTAFALGLDAELTIDTCASGEEAVERVAAAKPDLVLLDLELPGINGLETAKRIAPVPVILMTGKQSVQLGDALVRGVIKKPFDPTTLAAQVRAML